MTDYIEHTKYKEQFEYNNFFDPKQIVDLKTQMTSNSEFIFKLKGKQYKLWRPDKFVLTKTLKDVLEKT